MCLEEEDEERGVGEVYIITDIIPNDISAHAEFLAFRAVMHDIDPLSPKSTELSP